MDRKLLCLGVVIAVAVVLAGADELRAGITGKIIGVVWDAAGTPLPGANVVLKEVNLGGTADADSYYMILNVPPGTYTLTASLIGYETVSKTGVGVIVDHTTTIDFSLKEAAVELQEIVVVAERPLVEPDKTSSKYTVDLDEVERSLSSGRSTAELLQLLPGIAVDGSNRIRGGFVGGAMYYGTDVAYMVDGVRMNYNDNRGGGSAGAFTTVNRGIIQELAVLTGVTSAEYGNAQGGVVSIVTKDGGSQYKGWLETRYEPSGKKHWGANVFDAPQHRDKATWDDPNWRNEKHPDTGELIHVRSDYTDQLGWDVEGNLSGPIGANVSFVATLKHSRVANPLPGPERTGFYNDRGQFVATGPNNITTSGNLTFRPTPELKVKVGGLYQWWKIWAGSTPDTYTAGVGVSTFLSGVVRGTTDNGRDLFLPEKWSGGGRQTNTEELMYVVFTQTLSPRTFYEVRISHSRSQSDTSGTSDATEPNKKDAAGWFNLARKVSRYNVSDRKRFGIKVDLSSQMTKGHFVKAGLEFLRGSVHLFQRWDSNPADRRFVFIGKDNIFGKPEHPIFFNAYVQDKMEFEGMIVNVGIRMDGFNPNTRDVPLGAYMGAPMFYRYTWARDYLYQEGSHYVTDSQQQLRFSPRLGLSHPITQRSQMWFSSGVYLQWLDLSAYYEKDYQSFGHGVDRDVNGNGKIDDTERFNQMRMTYAGIRGNINLKPAKTTAFEAGMAWNFVSDYTATLSAYFKSEVDHPSNLSGQGWRGAWTGYKRYNRYTVNGVHGNTRGIELSARKEFSHHFSFKVSYNYQWSQWTTGKRFTGTMRIQQDAESVRRMAGTIMYTHPETGAPVPQLFLDWAPHPSGREVPVPMTEQQIVDQGKQVQGRYNSELDCCQAGSYSGVTNWEGLLPTPGPPGVNGLKVQVGGTSRVEMMPKPGDRRNFGSAVFLASLPDKFQFGPPFLGRLLSNVRMNLVTRIQTGTLFRYTPPQGGEQSWRELAMDSRTDLALEKTFNVNRRVQPTVFLDVRNLFNQQDRTNPTSSSDYTYFGIVGSKPDNPIYLSYGDARDRIYAHTPRLTHIGVRLAW